LPEPVVRHGDHGAAVDRIVHLDQFLNLAGADRLSPTVDDVLHAAHDDDPTFRGPADDVAGAIPAVRGERRRVAAGRPEVAADGVRSACPEFSWVFRADVVTVVVDHSEFVPAAHGSALGGETNG